MSPLTAVNVRACCQKIMCYNVLHTAEVPAEYTEVCTSYNTVDKKERGRLGERIKDVWIR